MKCWYFGITCRVLTKGMAHNIFENAAFFVEAPKCLKYTHGHVRVLELCF